ncbi:hypothetical protein L1987_70536 [Smallanthus sonchifolius]|uniref:Uncharacterized protein n=1 Tax=Smallanthus sonchifolius TaxID=185202 RepID=A0ACB9AQ56_9ASTR|nr:hypothetical protein L1987_70536 [Smallanthus sonchifolius]
MDFVFKKQGIIKMLKFNLMLVVVLCLWVSFCTASVSYDHKAISINGQRKILISGSIHYPRSTPEMWQILFRRQKKEGWM